MNDPTPPEPDTKPVDLDPRAPARAITQIAVSNGGGPNNPDYLYALANDGSVWRLAVKLHYEWFQLPALPTTVSIGQRPSTVI
jgi:hypothetical protein